MTSKTIFTIAIGLLIPTTLLAEKISTNPSQTGYYVNTPKKDKAKDVFIRHPNYNSETYTTGNTHRPNYPNNYGGAAYDFNVYVPYDRGHRKRDYGDGRNYRGRK